MVTLEKPVIDGMSGLDVVRSQIHKKEQRREMLQERVASAARRLSEMEIRYDARTTPRRERLGLEVDIEVQKNNLNALYRDLDAVNYELRGMRQTADIIVYLSANGGIVTHRNRAGLEAILY